MKTTITEKQQFKVNNQTMEANYLKKSKDQTIYWLQRNKREIENTYWNFYK